MRAVSLSLEDVMNRTLVLIVSVALLCGTAACAHKQAVAPSRDQAPPPAAAVSGPEARAAFSRLKDLAGRWEGRVTKGGHGDHKNVIVEYRVTSGGSAVEELLFPGTPHEMVSVYHFSGDALVMTHYCALGNQPTMALKNVSADGSTLSFDFVPSTGIAEAKDPHMHHLELSLPSGSAGSTPLRSRSIKKGASQPTLVHTWTLANGAPEMPSETSFAFHRADVRAKKRHS